MSIETMALVLHHSRASGTEKVILLGIANHDGDLGAYPGIPTLARYANVSESTAREAVRRLEACPDAGACPESERRKDKTCPHLDEITVAIGAGPLVNGGRTNRYDVRVSCPPTCDGTAKHKPRKPAPEPKPETSHRPTGGGVDEPTPHRPTGATSHRPTGATPHRPTGAEPSEEPSMNLPPTPRGSAMPESVVRLWEGEGITEEERAALWADLVADPDTLVPGRRALQPAYYVAAVAKIRAQQGIARGKSIEQVRRFGEPCKHDQPGGAEPHPTTGLPLCPLCRAEAIR